MFFLKFYVCSHNELAHKINGKVGLKFIEDDSDKIEEEWLLNFTPGVSAEDSMKVGKGFEADAHLTMSGDTFEKLLFGKLSPEFAYLRGLLKVEGSTSVAMKLKILVAKVKNLSI